MALKDAMDGVGTDEPAIHAVYARIRDQVEHEGAEKGWKTAQIDAELKRRTGQLKGVYDKTFDATLEEDFDSELSGGELNLALAEHAGDQTGMDAAEIQIEHLSAWTSDDKVNEILKSQYLRAEREIMRDLSVDFQRQAAQLAREQRAAAWKALQKQGREDAAKRSRDYMKDLKSRYDATSLDTSTFDSVIKVELSGYSQEEARKRIAAGGKLSDAGELKYAIFGLGTNEKTIREVLKGKSKAELDQLSSTYEQLTGNNLMSDLKGDLAGRDEADMTLLLQTGDSTKEERAAYLDKRSRWELNEGTGDWGMLADGEEARILAGTNAEVQAQLKEYESLKSLPEDDPRRRAAEGRLESWLGYRDKDIDAPRRGLDSITDTIAMVGAITVGVAAGILSGGAGFVGALALYFGTTTTVIAAGVGPIAAAGASMVIKEEMKGAAYGGEDIAVDIAQGTADAVLAVATAGVGEAAIKALARAPAFAVLARAAEAGTLAQMGVKGAGSGIEGLIQGLPSGMMSAILNEDTWRSPNPLAVILDSGRKGALQSAGMGAGMGAGIHGIHAGVRGLRGAGEHAAPHGETEPHAGDDPTTLDPRDLERRADTSDPDDWMDDLDLDDDGAPETLELQFEEEPTDEPDFGASSDFEDAPTKTWDAPGGELPVSDLWDGTIVDRDPPLTVAEAERIYDNMIADSKGRNEAMIWRHMITGERIVIQGNRKG